VEVVEVIKGFEYLERCLYIEELERVGLEEAVFIEEELDVKEVEWPGP
jgi:hypothetical protein